MGQFELKIYPDPCLRIKTKPVERFTGEIKDILRSMSDIMYRSRGIGLASPQIGVGLSILVVDIGEGLLNFINPVILEGSAERSKFDEGCLSIPGVTVNVKRPEKIKVRAQNENGDFFIREFDGLPARALQHEIDHLRGRLIIDYLDPVRRFIVLKRKSTKKRGQKEITCEVTCNVKR
ncbi:MAG: peptide deformylase [Candidatus Omnitrophota bacterium]